MEEEDDLQIVDVGIDVPRSVWLVNGMHVFKGKGGRTVSPTQLKNELMSLTGKLPKWRSMLFAEIVSNEHDNVLARGACGLFCKHCSFLKTSSTSS